MGVVLVAKTPVWVAGAFGVLSTVSSGYQAYQSGMRVAELPQVKAEQQQRASQAVILSRLDEFEAQLIAQIGDVAQEVRAFSAAHAKAEAHLAQTLHAGEGIAAVYATLENSQRTVLAAEADLKVGLTTTLKGSIDTAVRFVEEHRKLVDRADPDVEIEATAFLLSPPADASTAKQRQRRLLERLADAESRARDCVAHVDWQLDAARRAGESLKE